MGIFSYKAQDIHGQIQEDTISASTREDAISALKASNLQILTLKSADIMGLAGYGRISLEEKVAFCRFMATMLHSGLSIPEALEIMRSETKRSRMKKLLSDLSFQTQKGKNLTSVLTQYKNDFDPVFLTMIKVGEESGTLEKSFEYLNKQLAASHEFTQKVKGALMYPAIILIAMILNGLVMVLFVLPKVAAVFLKLDVPLPLPTKIILTVGELIGTHTFLSIFGLIALIVLSILVLYIKSTRDFLFRRLQQLPIIHPIVTQIDLARFARTLSTLSRSGVSITESLNVTAEILTDTKLRNQAKKFSDGVSKGESLYQVLSKNNKLFPPLMLETIKAGEKTGTLDQTLEEMAIFYESEVDYALKRGTALLEPVLMLFIGIVVGAMVIIMVAPIYGIIGGLQSQIGSPSK